MNPKPGPGEYIARKSFLPGGRSRSILTLPPDRVPLPSTVPNGALTSTEPVGVITLPEIGVTVTVTSTTPPAADGDDGETLALIEVGTSDTENGTGDDVDGR